VRVPAQLAGIPPVSQPELMPPAEAAPVPLAAPEPSLVALEVDRVVPPSGNLWIGGQQAWLGPALSGRTITIWVDETSLHVVIGGSRLKTLPSRVGVTELARLAAGGARPAGPSPLPPGNSRAVEVERMVNATGLVGLAGVQVSVGFEFAGQRVTLGMDGTQMAVISHDGVLLRTLPCPVTVQRRVSQRGQIMVATQRIQVGMIHARKTVTVIAEDHDFRLLLDGNRRRRAAAGP
jgi:hypothetical protein